MNHAEDVVQNTYVSLLMYLPDDIKYEKSYVFQVLKNEIAKFLKKESRYEIEQIDDIEEITSEEDFINDFLNIYDCHFVKRSYKFADIRKGKMMQKKMIKYVISAAVLAFSLLLGASMTL